uniref:hypothetical protein n=1 Tax=Synechococcus sp. UW106 TaxID=368495 RepID=UPI000E0FA4CE|nr:hypothetical protein [Synechococcus sp. UW106]
MPKQAWAEPTKELRSLFPEVEGLRLRSAKRGGKTVYQVLFEVDGKSKALQLDATSPTQAYEAAKVVLAERTTGKVTSGRIPPAGLLRRTEIAARQSILDEGLRQETTHAKVRALEAAVGWFTERGLGLTANTLLDCIRATDRTKRERRSRTTACRLLAKEAGIPLEVPSGLLYLNPGAKRREVHGVDEKLLYRELNNLEKIPDWARYIFRVVACTGCRANAVFSMEIPRGPITPGPKSIMRYVDSKRTTDRIVYCDATSSLLLGDENAWNVWRLWEVPEEIEALQHRGRYPTDEELFAGNRLTASAQQKLRRAYPEAPRWLEYMTFRYLRHLTVKRLFALPGMDEYKVSQLVSTSVAQLQKTYGQLYKATAVSTVHDALPWKIASTEEDAKAALRKALD